MHLSPPSIRRLCSQVSCGGSGAKGRFSVPGSAAEPLGDCGQVPRWPEGSDFQNSYRTAYSHSPRRALSPLACKRDLPYGVLGCCKGSNCQTARWSPMERDT